MSFPRIEIELPYQRALEGRKATQETQLRDICKVIRSSDARGRGNPTKHAEDVDGSFARPKYTYSRSSTLLNSLSLKRNLFGQYHFGVLDFIATVPTHVTVRSQAVSNST